MPTIPPRYTPPPIFDGNDGADDDAISPFVAFGTAAFGGLLAAAFASGPAAFRVSAALAGAGSAWPALAAVELPAMMIAIYVLRRARIGLRVFGGPGAYERALAFVLGATFLLLSLTVLGAVLRATTHHHALAGATFAMLALFVAGALVPIASRSAAIARGWLDRRAYVPLAAGTVALLGVVLGAMWRLARALPASEALSASGSALVVDVVAFGVMALLASRPEVAERRVLAWFGPPVAAIVIAIGVVSLVRSPALADTIVEQAPAFAPAVRVVVH